MAEEVEGRRNYHTGHHLSFKQYGNCVLFVYDEESEGARVLLVENPPQNPDFERKRAVSEFNIIESNLMRRALSELTDLTGVDDLTELLSYGRSVSLSLVLDHDAVKLDDTALSPTEEIKVVYQIVKRETPVTHCVWTMSGCYILITNGRVLLTTAEDDPHPDYVGRRIIDSNDIDLLSCCSSLDEDQEFFFAEVLGLGRGHELRGVNPKKIVMQNGELMDDEIILMVLEVC